MTYTTIVFILFAKKYFYIHKNTKKKNIYGKFKWFINRNEHCQKVQINLNNQYYQTINTLSELKNTSKDKIFNLLIKYALENLDEDEKSKLNI